MPAVPGEALLTTLFADVHYYFSPPTHKPLHHRFSRGSYVYLYHNTEEHRSKLEVANHAGTPEQDAFSGYMDVVSNVRYSYKQPTMCTVTIDGSMVQHHDQWHIPSFNERNEQKYLCKINTLDIYLWTEKDAATFLGHLKAVLPAEKLDIRDAPASLKPSSTPAEHRDSMSPVVQQLERTAVGAQFPPRTDTANSVQSLPGPPTPATGSTASPVQQQTPAPMAYNPAAPAAPEPIAYREKTPPPPDDGTGTGLSHAAKHDTIPQQQYASAPNFGPFAGSQQPTPSQSYFPGPPPGAPTQRPQTNSMPPPPPPPVGGPSPSNSAAQMHFAQTFAGPPKASSAQPGSPPPAQQNFRQSVYGQPQTQYANYPQQTQYAGYQQSPNFGPSVQSPAAHGPHPGTPGFQQQQQQLSTPSQPPAYGGHTPLQSPGLPMQSPGLPPPPSSQPPGQPSFPLGSQVAAQQPTQPAQQAQRGGFGYSNYNYQASQAAPQHGAQGAYTGDVHSQVYRPTEAEAGHGAKASRPQQPPAQGSFSEKYQVQDRVQKVEKGVGRFLKKLDSKW